MIWSQLKKQVCERICEELRGRVDFHRAVYRHPRETPEERAWISLDGEPVYSLSELAWRKAWTEAKAAAEETSPEADCHTLSEAIGERLGAAGVEHPQSLGGALHRFLEMDIATAQASPNPVVRALAMIDRRTGKRALARLKPGPDEHPLVRRFWEARAGAMTG